MSRVADGEAAACGAHMRDPDSGTYNFPWVSQVLGGRDVVVVRWASGCKAYWWLLKIRWGSAVSPISAEVQNREWASVRKAREVKCCCASFSLEPISNWTM